MTIWNAVKEKYQNWLNSMSEANRKQFGEKTPDCCGLLNDRKNSHKETEGPQLK